MNYQRTVLWLGLILIALNLVKSWSVIKTAIFTTSATSTPGNSGINSGISGFLAPVLGSEPTGNPPANVGPAVAV